MQKIFNSELQSIGHSKKKNSWLYLAVLLLFITVAGLQAGEEIKQAQSVREQSAQEQPEGIYGLGDTVIGMSLEDYRQYQVLYGPLDRLYCQEGNCYFLVDEVQLTTVENSGFGLFKKEPALDFISPAPPYLSSSADGDPNGRFHNVRETYEEMAELENSFQGLAKVMTIGQTLEGRELKVIKISDNVDSEENEPNFFYCGAHHAREWISVEVPLKFARWLLENYNSNPEAQKAVSESQIYIMPIQNPDGLEFSIHTYRLWRKNRSYNGNFIWGVDTNRNYGFNWGYDNEGSSPLPYSYVYRGPSGFSEPETQAVRDFLIRHPPAGAITFHSFAQLIIVPWGYTYEPAPDSHMMLGLAAEMSIRMSQVNGTLYRFGSSEELYLVNGDTTDWIYGTFGTPAFTIELPPATVTFGGFVAPESLIDPVCDENITALIFFNNYLIDTWTGNQNKIEYSGKGIDIDNNRPKM